MSRKRIGSRIHIRALGGFSVSVNGLNQTRELQRKAKLTELLQVIVCNGGHHVPSTAICRSVWPDADGDRAIQSLEIAVHRLRRLLGRETIVVASRLVGLSSQYCELDVWKLDHALEALERILYHERLRIDRVEAKAIGCMDAYAGSLLPGAELSWVHRPRADLRSRLVRQVTVATSILRECGEPLAAAELLERLVAVEPGAEVVYRDLILSYKKLGRFADAADAFRRCREYFSDSQGVRLSADTLAAIRTD